MTVSNSPEICKIESLTHDGRGVSHINGQVIFIEDALPGETVSFTYTKRNRNYLQGKTVDIIEPSPQRCIPKCPHFTICGGCSMQHLEASAQIQVKQQILLEQLQHLGKVTPELIIPATTGPHWGYRRKARFSVKNVSNKGILVGFHEKNGRYIAKMNSCEILHPKLGQLIEPLKTLIASTHAYQTIPQIELAMGDTDAALVIRHLKPLHADDIKQLNTFANTHSLKIFLQPGGMDSIHLLSPKIEKACEPGTGSRSPEDPTTQGCVVGSQEHFRLKESGAQSPAHIPTLLKDSERCLPHRIPLEYLSYTIPAQNLEFLFHPTDFCQNNLEINRKLITLALELLELNKDDIVLDLFCGIGNFSLPLAQHSQKVIGVDSNAAAIERAYLNAKHNHIENAEFHCFDLTQDFSQQSWAKQTFTKMLLDPSRMGAANVVATCANFNISTIVYISCNPATLARDAGLLAQLGYRLHKVGVLDMFPHTTHVESIGLFVRD